MKRQNVVIKDGHVKLIDFGTMVRATEENMDRPSAHSAGYAPPEFQSGDLGPPHAFSIQSPHSYDIYAVGIMYWQLLCPKSRVADVADYLHPEVNISPFSSQWFDSILPERCPKLIADEEDLDLIRELTAMDPLQRPTPKDAMSQIPDGDFSGTSWTVAYQAHLEAKAAAKKDYGCGSVRYSRQGPAKPSQEFVMEDLVVTKVIDSGAESSVTRAGVKPGWILKRLIVEQPEMEFTSEQLGQMKLAMPQYDKAVDDVPGDAIFVFGPPPSDGKDCETARYQ